MIKKLKKVSIRFILLFKKVNLIWISLMVFAVLACIFSNNILSYLGDNVKSKKFKEYALEIHDYKLVMDMFDKRITYGIAILLIIILVLSVISRFIKEKKEEIHILAQTTFKESQFELNENREIIIDINLNVKSEVPNIDDLNFKEKMNALVCRQDSEVNSFKNKINNKYDYGYMGISHTPFILRFGSELGDGIKLIPLHKKRNDKFYSILNKKKEFPELKIIKKISNIDSRELIISIATTNEIKDYQLYEFDIENKNLIMFECEVLGFDVIESEIQLNNYIEIILVNIRNIIKNNNIKKTHLVISSSITFTLALGQRLTNSYDREIIIYNYGYIPAKDNKSKDIYYPWGINLFKAGIDCVIKKT
ncbi:hypothetical protein CYK62_14565 [Clostridium perfringens]|uniref:SAVED domain-containing protein n=2 Tax=Clostridium perfringens TaxID=1502 RepID=UPI000D70CA41|nr:SAVED domain-containing protein [Clostridium perfringens]PWW86762.1 hypothetical protein CYK79_16445 [Clostridium perfringens]PWW89331.1 hypothetical protein CYK84_15675 [Clostridium perfringens]PWX18498.1 hypothetical protein CYK62_14565 [Clostridium perfringens]PWX64121.1 hypothetical protein CYK78_16985 [Clostridium perfringens]PZT49248.1 hypothetical protein CYK80_16720 [Clostridium perfringens]